MSPEQQAALVAIKEAAERFERTGREHEDAWRDVQQALADYRKASGQVLHVTALSGPIGSVWTQERRYP